MGPRLRRPRANFFSSRFRRGVDAYWLADGPWCRFCFVPLRYLTLYFYLSYFDPLLASFFFSVFFRSHLPGAVRIGFVDYCAARYAHGGCFSVLVLMERATTLAPGTRGLGTSARLSNDIRRACCNPPSTPQAKCESLRLARLTN